MVIYLLNLWPLESKTATKIEVFNEQTCFMLLYGLMLFSDFVASPETRYSVGWLYIAVVASNILVHASILIFDTCTQLYRSLRRR